MIRALLAHRQELTNCKCSLTSWHAVVAQSLIVMAIVSHIPKTNTLAYYFTDTAHNPQGAKKPTSPDIPHPEHKQMHHQSHANHNSINHSTPPK